MCFLVVSFSSVKPINIWKKCLYFVSMDMSVKSIIRNTYNDIYTRTFSEQNLQYLSHVGDNFEFQDG